MTGTRSLQAPKDGTGTTVAVGVLGVAALPGLEPVEERITRVYHLTKGNR